MKWLKKESSLTSLLKKKNTLDRILEKSREENAKRFLVVWNRGLGDIPLGLYSFILRVRYFIPDAEITFITRDELGPAFTLLEHAKAVTVPWWERGKKSDIKETISRLNLDGTYDVLIEDINPTKWLSWQTGRITPKLQWNNEHNDLWKRFGLDPDLLYIGAHVNTETQQFYGYRKDWPIENWRRLFDSICAMKDARIILFGLNKTEEFLHPSILDLRGETGLLEMLSIIINRCRVLIAPDGGILSMTYYIGLQFPITVVSLWSDPNQGILKQGVPSPNKLLIHIPIKGRSDDITDIKVEDVLSAIKPLCKMTVSGIRD